MIVKLITEMGNEVVSDEAVIEDTVRLTDQCSERTYCASGSFDNQGVPIFRFAGRMPIEFLINPIHTSGLNYEYH